MYEALLILHFLGLTAGIGSSLFMAGLGMRTAGLSPEAGMTVMTTATSVAAVLSAGSLVLLWGTGIAMVSTTEGLAQSGGWFFYVKLILAFVLTVLVALIHRQSARMKRGGGESVARSMQRLGQAVLVLGISVVVLAVLAFS